MGKAVKRLGEGVPKRKMGDALRETFHAFVEELAKDDLLERFGEGVFDFLVEVVTELDVLEIWWEVMNGLVVIVPHGEVFHRRG